MRIFIGFGYNDNDKWIADVVIPFVKVLDCEVLTGEEMQGQRLSDGVLTRIKQADALIGFLTKRSGPAANGSFTTHQWGIEEVAAALALNKDIFVIREKGVDPQAGISGDRQKFEFDEKLNVMLEIATFINAQKAKRLYKTFMLLPQEFTELIRPHYKFAKCSYKFWDSGREYQSEPTQLIRMNGGFQVAISNIPNDYCTVQITVEFPGHIWSSDYVPVALNNVQLQKDN